MHPIQVSDDTFEALVLKSDVPVVVDFWAPWCGPCLNIAPKLEALNEHYSGRLVVVKVNRDENPQSAELYKAQGIPHLIFFNKGEEVGRHVGDTASERLRIVFDEFLAGTGDTSVAFPSAEAEAAFKAAVAEAEEILDAACEVAAAEFRSQPAFAELSEASQPIRDAALAELEARRAEFSDANEFERAVSMRCHELRSEERFAEQASRIAAALETINANQEARQKMDDAFAAAEDVFNQSVASARTAHKG